MSKRESTNREFASHDVRFIASCQEAGIEPTKRQASKFRRKMGTAWKARGQALTHLPLQIDKASRDAIYLRAQVDGMESLIEQIKDDSKREEFQSQYDDLNSAYTAKMSEHSKLCERLERIK